MSIPRPTETRATILAVASRLFAQRGYEGVSVRDITGAAGMSTGALFTHWPAGKDSLFAEVMGRPRLKDADGAALLAALAKIAVGDGDHRQLARSAIKSVTGAWFVGSDRKQHFGLDGCVITLLGGG